jgi:hypothetical protein
MDSHSGQQDNLNSHLAPVSYHPHSQPTRVVLVTQPSAEAALRLDSIAYSQLSWFFKLIRAGPAWLVVCSCLEPRELVRLASLCWFTRSRIIADARFMNAVNRWKLNPARDWAHFHALMRLQAALAKAL